MRAYFFLFLGTSFYALCFPPVCLPFFSFLVMPCYLAAITASKTKRHCLSLGFFHSLLAMAFGFSWIMYLAENYGGASKPIAFLGLLLFSLIVAPPVIAFFVLAANFRTEIFQKSLSIQILFWPSLFTGCEYTLRFLKILPDHLGNTWFYFLPAAQLASIGGVSLLTFFSTFVGSSLYFSYQKKKPLWLAPAFGLILATFLWGSHEQKYWNSLPHESLRVALVQPNMAEHEKSAVLDRSLEQFNRVLYQLLKLSKSIVDHNPKPHLVVWPESAYSTFFASRAGDILTPSDQIYQDHLQKEIGASQTPLLFGTLELTSDKKYNTATLLSRDGAVIDNHRKKYLLVFGEYMPLSGIFPWLENLNPRVGNFSRGNDPHPLLLEYEPHKKIQLGVNICYEADFPEFLRDLKNQGAQVFINLTKDSWYGNTQEPWQHFLVAAFRAIETRTSMARITNTGLSGILLPSGEHEYLSVPYQDAAKTFSLPFYSQPQPRTLYQILGEWFGQACALLSFLYLARLKWLERKFKPEW